MAAAAPLEPEVIKKGKAAEGGEAEVQEEGDEKAETKRKEAKKPEGKK